MKNFFSLSIAVVIAMLSITSCSNDDEVTPVNKTVSHVLVLNEGNSTGGISYIDADGNVNNDYFKSVNKIDLGKFPQSIAANEQDVFIVVTTDNGAGYVLVADKSTLKVKKTITGFSYPREIVLLEDKAYISNGNGVSGVWPNQTTQNNEVHVLDLNTFTITGTIPVGAGPEKMVASNGMVYVANSGGWSNDDNTVSVINTQTDKVVETLTVKYCPKDMEVDANGDVWVYCGGIPNWTTGTETDAGISKITVPTHEVKSWDVEDVAGGTKNMAISTDKKTLFFITDAVYAMNIASTTLPKDKLIDLTFNGIDVHPIGNTLWLCHSESATEAGSVLVYDANGMQIKEYTVGNVPNSCIFVF
ncbi:40-residue YVTN family beta-propeller repeat-containing protein [Saccharicrinis carchari]|uniref:40-residue YVTN family beta-propeller repeat-containing protein n=1 Tax=Saccharicrinis carchari TaxID=1168039 RepID=A0A521AM50_SACCC|nr:DUF5074 domain-containing protein [Saccharicrinis carchari]SMO35851.1 40-residue YVTN family beta-propeller repeat-containing protein [Saccharicrinis carchari]